MSGDVGGGEGSFGWGIELGMGYWFLWGRDSVGLEFNFR